MATKSWRVLLVCGVSAAVAAARLGEDAQSIVLLATSLVAVPCVWVGARWHRTQQRAPWFYMATMMAVFMVAALVQAAVPGLREGEGNGATLADGLNAFGYLLAIASAIRLGQLRTHGKDPTNVLDALILTIGVAVVIWANWLLPFVGRDEVFLTKRLVAVAFSVLDLILLFNIARLAIGPGARNPSYHLLASAACFALATDLVVVLVEQGASHLPGLAVASILMPSIAFTCIGAAALHPSMGKITLPTTIEIGVMTRRRLGLTLVAMCLVPLQLWVTIWRGDVGTASWLFPGWLVMAAIVMLRLYGLIRAQEQVAQLERALSRAAASLVVATTREEMCRSALASATDLVGAGAHRLRVSLLLRTGEGWSVAVTSGHDAYLVKGTTVPVERIEALVGKSGHRPLQMHGVAPLDLATESDAAWVAAPLISQNQLRGVLVVTTAEPIAIPVVEALASLATDLAFALEAAALTEDVHRRRSDRRFRKLVENAGDVIAVFAGDEEVNFLSPAAERLLAPGAGSNQLLNAVVESDQEAVRTLVGEARERMSGRVLQFRVKDPKGRERLFEATATDMRDEPDVAGIVLNARDVTDRNAAEVRFRSLVQHSSDVIAILDADEHLTYVSPSCMAMLGYTARDLTGSSMATVLHPDDRVVLDQAVARAQVAGGGGRPGKIEVRLRTRSNNWRTLELTVTDLRHDPAVGGLVLNAHDVTERKALEDDLRRKALYDDLTGLANRALFRDRLKHALALRRGGNALTGVLFVDLTNFTNFTDALGHEAGDDILKIMAFRLQQFVRQQGGDTVARHGDHLFAVLLEKVSSPKVFASIASRCLEELQAPFNIGGRELSIKVAVGVVGVDSGDESDPEVIIRNADAALHVAALGSTGWQLFDDTMHADASEQLELQSDLVHALERDELSLHYQPIVRLPDGELLGFEALLRWNRPERKFVGPDRFIPIAEETGLIVPIGLWVLREALTSLARWQRRSPAVDLKMSVNLAPRQLMEPTIVEDIMGILRDTGVASSSLTLELTESAQLHDSACQERLARLHQLGIGIAADDFGSGFANYAALGELPFTIIKLDRSLLQGLAKNREHAEAQIGSIIDMSHRMNRVVVAEGVEEPEERDFLVSTGCDRAQGYFYGRPVPGAEAEAVVSKASELQGVNQA